MGKHPAGTGAQDAMIDDIRGVRRVRAEQRQLAGTLLTCVLVLGNAHANAQTGAKPAAPPPTTDDVCRTLEQAAAENALPLEFFARVIWQESRFDVRDLSSKGAKGIAQFMPQTAHSHGLRDPLNPIEALRHAAGYLRELRERFGNLGLAAAAYNAGPGRVSSWLINHRPLPGETRNYVAMVTGSTADKWASRSPPQTVDATIPQGVPCTQAHFALAPGAEANHIESNAQKHMAVAIDARADPVPPTTDPRAFDESIALGGEKNTAPSIPEPAAPQASTSTQAEARASDDAESIAPGSEKSTAPSIPEPLLPQTAPWPDASPAVAVPRWGVWLAVNLSESKAWALYRERLWRFASLIGDREPVVLFRQLPGMGTAKRYIIAIADDDRAPLDEFCEKLIAAGGACDVMRNEFAP
jgi:hypothetical protein